MTAEPGIVALSIGLPAAMRPGGGVTAPPSEALDDLATGVDRARELVRAGEPPEVIIVGPGLGRPLAAAQELQRVVPSAEFLFVVASDDVSDLEVRLALVPELSGGVVVPLESAAGDLAGAIRDLRSAASRRDKVRAALDAMNRTLLGDLPPDAGGVRAHVSESYLAALARHAPDAIVSVDAASSVVAVNDAATRILGLSAEDVEGRRLSEVLPSAEGADLHVLVADALAGEERIREEIRFRPGGSQEVLAAVTAAPIRDRLGAVAGVVLIARDITEERRTEERLRQLDKAESLATLAGGVAHDFNNLLVSVRGWADIASEEPEDTETVAMALEHIRTAADRAADLARAMLAYGGRGRFELGPVDVGELISEMARLLRASVGRKVRLEFAVDDDLPEVTADETQLRQVVMNLVTNASEAIGDRSGTIHLRACVRRVEAGGGAEAEVTDLAAGRYVVVEVADTGPGMDAETVERVFDPFFTTKFAGRGLGLAASHGMVRALGGAITAANQAGGGAMFRVFLPCGPRRPPTTA